MQGGGIAKNPLGLAQTAHLREGMEIGKVFGDHFIEGVSIGPNLAAKYPQPALLLRIESSLRQQPCLELGAKFSGFLLRGFGEQHVAVFIDRDPFPGGWVNVIVNIQ